MTMESPEAMTMTAINNYYYYANDIISDTHPRSIHIVSATGEEEEETQQQPSATATVKPMTSVVATNSTTTTTTTSDDKSFFHRFSRNKAAEAAEVEEEETNHNQNSNHSSNSAIIIDQQSRAAATASGATVTTNTTASTTAHAHAQPSQQRLSTTHEASLEASESSTNSDEAPIVTAAVSRSTNNSSKSTRLQFVLRRSLSLFGIGTGIGKLRPRKSLTASRNANNHKDKTMDMSGFQSPENVVQWLEAACPRDVVPKVLAYCGPQRTAALMKTNRFWFQLIANEDATWRPLCEGMYKWKEGRDKPPSSWKQYYRSHPCVPIDYSTIPKAMAVATPPKTKKKKGTAAAVRHYHFHNKREQINNVHILLRPGKHYVKESVLIEAAACVTVTLETMQLPANRFYNPRLAYRDQCGPQSCPEPRRNSTAASLLKKQLSRMNCKSSSSQQQQQQQQQTEDAVVVHNISNSDAYESAEDGSDDDSPLVFWNDSSTHSNSNNSHSHSYRSYHQSNNYNSFSTEHQPPKYPERASLILHTKKQNEPVIRVRQGALKLKQVDLYHACHGVDIWTGQAALQIQPPLTPDGMPIATGPRPWATVENCSITSKSGRGVVCLDGGYLTMRHSLIYDCAATGIYVGGPGSQADIEQTDVVRNGIGSRLPPSRAPRVSSGHSGVYLEQGLVRLHACNISSNYLTGISAISPDHAVLLLQKSDLIANGQCNLEMPPPGTSAYQHSVLEENNVASVGRPALRSNLELPNNGANRLAGSF